VGHISSRITIDVRLENALHKYQVATGP